MGFRKQTTRSNAAASCGSSSVYHTRPGRGAQIKASISSADKSRLNLGGLKLFTFAVQRALQPNCLSLLDFDVRDAPRAAQASRRCRYYTRLIYYFLI